MEVLTRAPAGTVLVMLFSIAVGMLALLARSQRLRASRMTQAATP